MTSKSRPPRFSRYEKQREIVRERVAAALGEGKICDRCGATYKTMNEACTADLLNKCPGFLAIDAVQVPIEREVFKLGR